jgi:phosphatidylinositol alpha 1,6-mannosyltransferase
MARNPFSHENRYKFRIERRGCSLSHVPRVAFLPDTFHEINGVAHTSRHLEAFARRKQTPFLSVHCGPATEFLQTGSVSVLQLRRGPFSFGLDANLECDPFLFRYAGEVVRAVRSFGAELIHITGPGDLGTLGAYVAWRLKLPLILSWHTSLHEYAERRAQSLLRGLGERVSSRTARIAERFALAILRWFYKRGQVLFAPNQEICEWLRRLTGRPVYLMSRGVDTDLYTPSRRRRTDGRFRIGYVGRLTVEKNVRFLADCARLLLAEGHKNFEIELIGQGRDSDWLRQNVPNAVLRGVLMGQELANAYADMDLFVFPSRTDTFGNVVLEALSSGVPAIVTDGGGPKHIVQHGETGFVAESDREFTEYVRCAYEGRSRLAEMSSAARAYAMTQNWDAVFQDVFAVYETTLSDVRARRSAMPTRHRAPASLKRSLS